MTCSHFHCIFLFLIRFPTPLPLEDYLETMIMFQYVDFLFSKKVQVSQGCIMESPLDCEDV